MFQELLNEMSDGTLHSLLSKLNQEGYIIKEADKSLISDADLADAWDNFYDDGAEAAVDYLETYFGFVFDRG